MSDRDPVKAMEALRFRVMADGQVEWTDLRGLAAWFKGAADAVAIRSDARSMAIGLASEAFERLAALLTVPGASEKAMEALKRYVQHKPECEMVKGRRFLDSGEWGEQFYSWRVDNRCKCTCGLSALLTVPGDPQQPEGPKK